MNDFSMQTEMMRGKNSAVRQKPWFTRLGQPVETDQYPLLEWDTWQKAGAGRRKAAAWSCFHAQVRRDDLTPADKLALWAIVDTLNTTTGCSTLTVTGLADMVGIARKTATRAVLELNQKNVIWSYMDGMPEVRPSEQHNLIMKNIHKVQNRTLRRYHCLVGLHFALANTLQE